METLRTPDESFAGLPDFGFAPRWVENLPGFEGLRIHCLDEGSSHASVTVLCLHGNPTWSYLYRYLPMAMPERFTRLLVMNTALGTGEVTDRFRQWRAYSNAQPDLAVGRLVQRGKPQLTLAEVAAYDAAPIASAALAHFELA